MMFKRLKVKGHHTSWQVTLAVDNTYHRLPVP